MSTPRRRLLVICFALFLISEITFLVNINYPKTFNFDEVQYVPAAKGYLDYNELRNIEHPPLAKEMIAIGIAIAGDNPLGWRLSSTIFGALTLVGIFLWAFALFKNEEMALLSAGFTYFNQLLYVQARIAMLDTIMMGFLAFALAFFTFSIDKKITRRQTLQYWLLSGLFFGLAAACKWFAIFPLAATALLIFVMRFRRYGYWRETKFKWFVGSFAVAPALTYFATFIPDCFFKTGAVNFFDILSLQYKMYDGQMRVVGDHPYISHWPSWPLMIRPIWYAFDKDGPNGEFIRGVLLLGNPVVLWGGLAALIYCAYRVYKHKNFTEFFVSKNFIEEHIAVCISNGDIEFFTILCFIFH